MFDRNGSETSGLASDDRRTPSPRPSYYRSRTQVPPETQQADSRVHAIGQSRWGSPLPPPSSNAFFARPTFEENMGQPRRNLRPRSVSRGSLASVPPTSASRFPAEHRTPRSVREQSRTADQYAGYEYPDPVISRPQTSERHRTPTAEADARWRREQVEARRATLPVDAQSPPLRRRTTAQGMAGWEVSDDYGYNDGKYDRDYGYNDRNDHSYSRGYKRR